MNRTIEFEDKKSESKKHGLFFKNLRDNLPLGIALATILGGINQYYNLLSIGSYYIRFFSVTQLLSDGLWILYLLLPFYIILLTILSFVFANDKHYYDVFEPTHKDGSLNRKKAILYNILVIIVVYAVCYYSVLSGMWKYASIAIGMYSFPAIMINLKLGKKYNNEVMFDIFYYINSFAFISSIYLTWTWAFNNNGIPKNLVNTVTLEKIIESYNPSYNYKILYMNDKYIFSKIYCDSINDPNAKIFIMPAETLTKIDETAANSR